MLEWFEIVFFFQISSGDVWVEYETFETRKGNCVKFCKIMLHKFSMQVFNIKFQYNFSIIIFRASFHFPFYLDKFLEDSGFSNYNYVFFYVLFPLKYKKYVWRCHRNIFSAFKILGRGRGKWKSRKNQGICHGILIIFSALFKRYLKTVRMVNDE